MPEPVVEIPNRPAFRASEVCEIAQIPPYVLKSWEKEFPGLGVASKPGGPRVYRRADVEQVVRIKHLLFSEGLTLAGARRKLEGEPKPEEEPLPELPASPDVRDKVARIKQDLRSLLDLLSTPPETRRAEGVAAASAEPTLEPNLEHGQPAAHEADLPGPVVPELPAESPAQPSWPPAPRGDAVAERDAPVEDLQLTGETAEPGPEPRGKTPRRPRKAKARG